MVRLPHIEVFRDDSLFLKIPFPFPTGAILWIQNPREMIFQYMSPTVYGGSFVTLKPSPFCSSYLERWNPSLSFPPKKDPADPADPTDPFDPRPRTCNNGCNRVLHRRPDVTSEQKVSESNEVSESSCGDLCHWEEPKKRSPSEWEADVTK